MSQVGRYHFVARPSLLHLAPVSTSSLSPLTFGRRPHILLFPHQQPSSGGSVSRASSTATGGQASEQGPSGSTLGLDTQEEEASQEDEAVLGPGGGSSGGGGGGGGVRGEEEDWEIVPDAEVPETCCGFVRLAEVSSTAVAAVRLSREVALEKVRNSREESSPAMTLSCYVIAWVCLRRH